MQNNFNKALEIVLLWEGGYVDHEKDPGGATNAGITQKTLSRWRKHAVSKTDVMLLTWPEIKDIYKTDYWFAASCDKLPAGLAVAMFDCAVNQGVGRAKRLLQKALRVRVDGQIGPITLAKAGAADEKKLLRDFMARRAVHYSGLKTLLVFGYGWFRRIFDVYGRALSYAT